MPYEIKFYQRDPKTNEEPAELKAVHPLGGSPIITEEEKVATESNNGDVVHDLSNLRELVHVRRHVDIATRGALVRFAQKKDEEIRGSSTQWPSAWQGHCNHRDRPERGDG